MSKSLFNNTEGAVADSLGWWRMRMETIGGLQCYKKEVETWR